MNPSKQKGTRAETKVVKYLTSFGIKAERRALSGSKDLGDIKVTTAAGTSAIIEVKAGKQTENPSRAQIMEWLRQTRTESINAGCPGILVVVRYRRALCDAEVYSIQANDSVVFGYLDKLAISLAE